jgi:hypothetical protein
MLASFVDSSDWRLAVDQCDAFCVSWWAVIDGQFERGDFGGIDVVFFVGSEVL